MKIAIITGASSGMGREFVYALDADEPFDELWVIARRRERLEELQAKTRAHVRVMALDLLDERSFDVVAEALAQAQPEVAVLVNAAGHDRLKRPRAHCYVPYLPAVSHQGQPDL